MYNSLTHQNNRSQHMATTMLKGNTVNLAGKAINVGDKAPEVTVVNSEGLGDVLVGGAQGVKQLIIVVPSLDRNNFV